MQMFRMPYGKYLGRTLPEVCDSDAGVKYLDRLRGTLHERSSVRHQINEYLNDPIRSHHIRSILCKEG